MGQWSVVRVRVGARARARARIGVVLLQQPPHLHAATRVEGEPHEAGGEAGLRAQLLHVQLACLAQRRVDEQVGLQRLVEGGEQVRRSVLHFDLLAGTPDVREHLLMTRGGRVSGT